MIKLWGAILIIAGCSGVGLAMCQNHRYLEKSLDYMARSLDWMALELNYRMSPLSELCRGAADIGQGGVKSVFQQLAIELDRQVIPDASACMTAALEKVPKLPLLVTEHFKNLGTTLGQFDLQGQIAGLEATAMLCRRDLEEVSRNRQLRLRNYQTLGICAGIGLVILFL